MKRAQRNRQTIESALELQRLGWNVKIRFEAVKGETQVTLNFENSALVNNAKPYEFAFGGYRPAPVNNDTKEAADVLTAYEWDEEVTA